MNKDVPAPEALLNHMLECWQAIKHEIENPDDYAEIRFNEPPRIIHLKKCGETKCRFTSESIEATLKLNACWISIPKNWLHSARLELYVRPIGLSSMSKPIQGWSKTESVQFSWPSDQFNRAHFINQASECIARVSAYLEAA